MNIKIREVSIEDLDELTAVEAICFPKAEAATKDSIKQRIETFPTSFYVAVIEDKIVGFINGCITNKEVIDDELFSDSSLHIPNGDYQAIFGLLVLPEFRKQGIAEALMNYLINLSKKHNRKGMILTCKEHLIPYYEKFAYKSKGVSNSQHGGAVWYDMILTF